MKIQSKAQTSLVAPQIYLIFSALSTICNENKEFPNVYTFMINFFYQKSMEVENIRLVEITSSKEYSMGIKNKSYSYLIISEHRILTDTEFGLVNISTVWGGDSHFKEIWDENNEKEVCLQYLNLRVKKKSNTFKWNEMQNYKMGRSKQLYLFTAALCSCYITLLKRYNVMFVAIRFFSLAAPW